MPTNDQKFEVLMVSTDRKSRGGVAAVVSTLIAGGLGDRVNIRFLTTHVDGPAHQKLAYYLLALLRLIPILIRSRCKILHVHTASRVSFYRKSIIVRLGALTDKKIILHLHGGQFMQFYRSESSALEKRYIRKTFALTDKVIVLSSQWREKISEIVDQSKIEIVFNPVLANAPKPAPGAQNILIFLGDVVERKGFWDLLEALAIVKKTTSNFYLKFGGKGEIDTAKQKINDLGLQSHVEFLGWVSGQDKTNLLQESLIYLLPSHDEGMPMGLLEAMAAGIPVITTSVGGIPDVIRHDSNGLIVPIEQPQALAAAILSLLQSESLRERLSSIARKDINNKFAADKIVKQLDRCYQNVLDD